MFEAVKANDCVTMLRLLRSGVPMDIGDRVTSPVSCMYYITDVSIFMYIDAVLILSTCRLWACVGSGVIWTSPHGMHVVMSLRC